MGDDGEGSGVTLDLGLWSHGSRVSEDPSLRRVVFRGKYTRFPKPVESLLPPSGKGSGGAYVGCPSSPLTTTPLCEEDGRTGPDGSVSIPVSRSWGGVVEVR